MIGLMLIIKGLEGGVRWLLLLLFLLLLLLPLLSLSSFSL
jgi:hypothetical protein